MYKLSDEQIKKTKSFVEKYRALNQEMVEIKTLMETKKIELDEILDKIKYQVKFEKEWIIEEANKLQITPSEFNAVLLEFYKK